MIKFQASGYVTLERHESDDWSSPLVRVRRSLVPFIIEARDGTDAIRVARSVIMAIAEPRGVNYYPEIAVTPLSGSARHGSIDA
jgi:hypothetical protein